MKRMPLPAKHVARQRWMRAYESAVLRVDPTALGYIDWTRAEYFYSIGADPKECAEKGVAQGTVKRAQS